MLCTKVLLCIVMTISFTFTSFSAEEGLSATSETPTTTKKADSSEKKSVVSKANENLAVKKKVKKKKRRKRRRRRKKRKINREKLEAYIKRGLEDGTITIDRLNKLEAKYFSKEFRYTPHVNLHPYMPHKWDYGLELGGMEIKKDLYWIGGNLGYNVGTCVLTKSPSCQQYMDVLLGSSGRDGETNWYGVLSLRWQFVNFPDTYSPIARVFAGVMNRIADGTNKQFFVYGLGYGMTTYLHPRADLRLESRVGWGQGIGSFTQAFVSVELKLSRWLDFFAGKLEKVGVGTGKIFKTGIGTTGRVIKGTGNVLKKGAEGTGTILKKGAEGTGTILKKGAEGTGTILKKGVEGTGAVIKGTGEVIKDGASAIASPDEKNSEDSKKKENSTEDKKIKEEASAEKVKSDLNGTDASSGSKQKTNE